MRAHKFQISTEGVYIYIRKACIKFVWKASSFVRKASTFIWKA